MINSVRNTVLSVLNKNNYGYISPSDFNLFAKQAQMEIYDEYFSSFNKTTNMENSRLSGTDYADIGKTISEVLETFLTQKFLLPKVQMGIGGVPISPEAFYLPSINTTGDQAYMINNVLCYNKRIMFATSSTTTVSPYTLNVDPPIDFYNVGVSDRDIVVNLTTNQSTLSFGIDSENVLLLQDDIFTSTDQAFAIYSYLDVSEAEKVSNGKIFQLNTSSITSPSKKYPAYSIINDVMYIYPSTYQYYGFVRATYFRYPKDPKWTYVSLFGGEPSFDQSQPDYQDFELPLEDEYKLSMKILQYCGVSIRESEVTQFGMAQEQHQQPSFSQKQ